MAKNNVHKRDNGFGHPKLWTGTSNDQRVIYQYRDQFIVGLATKLKLKRVVQRSWRVVRQDGTSYATPHLPSAMVSIDVELAKDV